MQALEKKLKEWARHRRTLERETQVLVVEEELASRKRFADFLSRHRIASRSVEAPDLALDLLDSGQFPLVLVSESLSGLGGLHFIRKLRRDYPSVDALLTATEPTAEIIAKAFELRLLDIISKQQLQFEVFGQRLRDALHRSLNRRMRTLMLMSLRDELKGLDATARLRLTTRLEEQLSQFKHRLGRFNRVLVVEGQNADLRLLGENLLPSGLRVEASPTLEIAFQHLEQTNLNLLIASASELTDRGMQMLLAQLRQHNPLCELMLVSPAGDIQLGLSALRSGVALFQPWPPASAQAMVLRLKDILRHCHKSQLMENLLAALFVQTSQVAAQPPPEESYQTFRKLVGLEHLTSLELLRGDKRPGAGREVAYLDEVLDNLLADNEDTHITQEVIDQETAAEAAGASSERRSHLRVSESQFVRFCPPDSPTTTLALVGDLSEGGLFIRTEDLQLPGVILQLELNAEYRGQGYLICCQGQVAWVAQTSEHFPMGPGFGVRFIEPPPDVVELLRQIVAELVQHHS